MQFAPIYPILYPILKKAFPECLWSGGGNSPAIALTFDDGPHRDYTPQLLQVLDHYNVTANFFLLGTCVKQNPNLVREIYQRGHWIGLHGYHHYSFPFLNKDTLKQSLIQTQEEIGVVLEDIPHCQLKAKQIIDVRPPNGLFTPKILKQLQQWHYRPVMWSVVPEDWVQPGIAIVRKRVLANVHNGALIVLHDGYYGGQDVAQITSTLIPQLRQQGYYFVTIKELWQQKFLS